MTDSHAHLYGRYLRAGAISRDPDAFAELFTEDGVYEAPLLPEDEARGSAAHANAPTSAALAHARSSVG
jgi:hypothetical protein